MALGAAVPATRWRRIALASGRWAFCGLAAGVTCLTALVVMPLFPNFPSGGLDASWQYATSYAVAHRMDFGTDFIWTYGPFGAVFTRLYEPRTYVYSLGLSFLVATGLSLGFASLGRGPLCLVLLLLPVLAAQDNVLDAIVAVTSFVFLLLSSERKAGRGWRTVLCLLAILLGAMPSIKGSYLIPTGMGGLAGLVLAWRESRRFAGALAICMVSGLIVPWMAIGQRVIDLPAYISTQFVLMAGFSAMSLAGPAAPVRIYLFSLVALLVVVLLVVRSGRWIVAGGFVVIAFFIFKAAFVRQDGHTLFAGGFLAMIGLALCLRTRSWLGVLPLAIGLIGGVGIDSYVIDSRPATLFRYATAKLEQSISGIGLMPQFPDAYAQARQKLVDGIPLLPDTGTADIYTVDTFLMLASDGRWSPRPIFQSYQAYTPILQRWNAEHIHGLKAPDTIFFRPVSIDERYPAFEDALSWPVLCARYEVTGVDHDFAVLRRRSTPAPVSFDQPLGSVAAQLGQTVPVPSGAVWATVDVTPSWRGRALDVIFRSSPLRFVVVYADGRQRSFRLLPAIARNGFLLSPTIETGADFASFREGRRIDEPGATVRSFRIVAEGSAGKDWRSAVLVRFFRFAAGADIEASSREPAGVPE